LSERGFSLAEALVALAIMGIAIVGVTPLFMTYLDANTLTEQRSGAVAAAQQILEGVRAQNPSSLPSSGASAAQSVMVGGRVYEVTTRYCVNASFCDTASRHVVVEVTYRGIRIFTAETVFTQLR
jgi:prepilin-type N-terminal cleavage/methylation domain-containing protein